MNHFKNSAIVLLAISLCGIGCGAQYDGDDGDDAIGTDEQDLSAKFSFGYTYGVGLNEPHLACKGVAGETCYMPAKRAFKVCFDPLLTAEAKGWFTEAFAAVQTATANRFTFSNQGNCAAGGGPLSSTDVIVNGAVTGACSSGGVNNIDTYACQNFSLVPPSFQLTDPFQGDYFRQASSGNTAPADPGHVATVMHVDYGEIDAKGANATEDHALGLHGAEYLIWGLIGIGGRLEAGLLTMTARSILPIATIRTEGSAGERCRAQSFTVDNLTTYTAPSGCGAD